MPISQSNVGVIGAPVLRGLDTVGDGSGTKDFIGNYSVTPTQAKIKPELYQVFILTEFIVQYSDAGKFQQGVYGSLATALPNGIIIGAYDKNDNLIFSLSNGTPIKTNDIWLHEGYHVALQEWGTATTTTLTATFDAVAFGTNFALNGRNQEYLKVTLQDDFTGLIDQNFLVKGFLL